MNKLFFLPRWSTSNTTWMYKKKMIEGKQLIIVNSQQSKWWLEAQFVSFLILPLPNGTFWCKKVGPATTSSQANNKEQYMK